MIVAPGPSGDTPPPPCAESQGPLQDDVLPFPVHQLELLNARKNGLNHKF